MSIPRRSPLSTRLPITQPPAYPDRTQRDPLANDRPFARLSLCNGCERPAVGLSTTQRPSCSLDDAQSLKDGHSAPDRHLVRSRSHEAGGAYDDPGAAIVLAPMAEEPALASRYKLGSGGAGLMRTALLRHPNLAFRPATPDG